MNERYQNLSPEKIFDLFRQGKALSLKKDNEFWHHLTKLHFRRNYWDEHLDTQIIKSWYTKFFQLYKQVYDGISEETCEVISLIRMQAGDQLKELLSNITSADDENATQKLLAAGIDLSARPKSSSRPSLLHIATFDHSTQIVELLLAYGVNVNATSNNDKQAPLHLAASLGYKDIVNLLLDNHAEINSFDIDGNTPLNYATYNGLHHIERILLARGGLVFINTVCHPSDIHDESSIDRNNRQKISALIRHKDSVNCNLQWAFLLRQIMLPYYLMETEFTHTNNDDDHSYLYKLITHIVENASALLVSEPYTHFVYNLSASLGAVRMGKILIKDSNSCTCMKFCRCNPDSCALKLGSFIKFAVNRPKLLSLLLKRNDFDVNAILDNDSVSTLFLYAAENGLFTSVRLVLERNDLDINVKNNLGHTALFCLLTCNMHTGKCKDLAGVLRQFGYGGYTSDPEDGSVETSIQKLLLSHPDIDCNTTHQVKLVRDRKYDYLESGTIVLGKLVNFFEMQRSIPLPEIIALTPLHICLLKPRFTPFIPFLLKAGAYPEFKLLDCTPLELAANIYAENSNFFDNIEKVRILEPLSVVDENRPIINQEARADIFLSLLKYGAGLYTNVSYLPTGLDTTNLVLIGLKIKGQAVSREMSGFEKAITTEKELFFALKAGVKIQKIALITLCDRLLLECVEPGIRLSLMKIKHMLGFVFSEIPAEGSLKGQCLNMLNHALYFPAPDKELLALRQGKMLQDLLSQLWICNQESPQNASANQETLTAQSNSIETGLANCSLSH